jgi:hypothetical protein
MPMFRERSKPVEARQWWEDTPEMRQWLGYAFVCELPDGRLQIINRDGAVVVNPGEWIVKDAGFYPVDPAVFSREYEAAT